MFSTIDCYIKGPWSNVKRPINFNKRDNQMTKPLMFLILILEHILFLSGTKCVLHARSLLHVPYIMWYSISTNKVHLTYRELLDWSIDRRHLICGNLSKEIPNAFAFHTQIKLIKLIKKILRTYSTVESCVTFVYYVDNR